MKEDEIVNALIKWARTSEDGDPDAKVRLFPEEHYNSYGNRGVVDLYETTGDWSGHLYEIKSESAVTESTGANEIVRQFNRMRQYFFKGSDHPIPTSDIVFELCFTPSKYNVHHILENSDMYSQIVQNDKLNTGATQRSQIVIRYPDPDDISPLLMFTGGYDIRDQLAEDGAENRLPNASERLYGQLKPAFEEFFEQNLN